MLSLIALVLAASSPLAPLHDGRFPVLVRASTPNDNSADKSPTSTTIRLLGFSTAGRIALLSEQEPAGMDGPDQSATYNEVDLTTDRVVFSESVYFSRPPQPQEHADIRKFLSLATRRLDTFAPASDIKMERFPAELEGKSFNVELGTRRKLADDYVPRPDESYLICGEAPCYEQPLIIRSPAGAKRIARLHTSVETTGKPELVGWFREPQQPRLIIVVSQKVRGAEAFCALQFRFIGARIDTGFE